MSQSKLHPEYLRQKALQDAIPGPQKQKGPISTTASTTVGKPGADPRIHPAELAVRPEPGDEPHFMERLGVNAVFNSGAIKLNGKYYLVARIEGNDRKSFFGVAESDSPVEGFHFWEKPILLPDTCPEETNVYDMRLTKHEDGWIYGIFCSESKDPDAPAGDLTSAIAAAGIIRSRDLKNWERLPNLVSQSQQRNVVLHPEFVDGKYALYTRPQDGFIDAGSGGGISWALIDDITHAVVKKEIVIEQRHYHTIKEVKNGEGTAPPSAPPKGGCTWRTEYADVPPDCAMCSICI